MLYDIKISLKKMNCERFKMNSGWLLYDSFFLRRYTTIYNIDNFYRIIVNFSKIKVKIWLCMEKKVIQKLSNSLW